MKFKIFGSWDHSAQGQNETIVNGLLVDEGRKYCLTLDKAERTYGFWVDKLSDRKKPIFEQGFSVVVEGPWDNILKFSENLLEKLNQRCLLLAGLKPIQLRQSMGQQFVGKLSGEAKESFLWRLYKEGFEGGCLIGDTVTINLNHDAPSMSADTLAFFKFYTFTPTLFVEIN